MIHKPILPRQQMALQRLDNNGSSAHHQFTSVEDMHRAQYFVGIDACLNELQHFESVIINAASGLSFELSETFQKSYKKDVNLNSLKSELQLLETITKQAFAEMKRVTSMETGMSVLTNEQNGTHLLPNVLRLMHIYLLAPLTAASAERSFSVQRIIKGYLRSTMTEWRYNNLLMLNMHRE